MGWSLAFLETCTIGQWTWTLLENFLCLCELEFMSQLWIQLKDQNQLWNPHDEQNSKLSFIFKFDKKLTEKIIFKDNFDKWSYSLPESILKYYLYLLEVVKMQTVCYVVLDIYIQCGTGSGLSN